MGKESKAKCNMTMCEDPKTGMVIVTYDGNCPDGYIEKLSGKMLTKGVRFEKEKGGEK